MTVTETPEVIDVIATPADPALVPAVREPVSALVRPAGSAADVAEAFTEYAAVCERVLDDGDYQAISGRRYRTKSAWRKLAVAYGVNISLVEERTERNEDGSLLRVHCTVRAEAPNGRYADGIGSCAVDEKRSWSHAEHDVRSTAYTRSANRACSDLFGLGEVSAEEMAGENPAAPALASPESMKALIQAAKEAKAAGVPVGEWPVVLGTRVFDVEKKVPTVNEGVVQTLLRAFTALDSGGVVDNDTPKPAPMVCRGCKEPITGEGDDQLPIIVDGETYHPACEPM